MIGKWYTQLIICYGFLRISYQQIPNSDLSFCLQQPSTMSTLQTFWQDASENCEMDPKRLMDLLKQLNANDHGTEDRCTLLLIHQIRKKVISLVSQQLEETLVTKSLRNNQELKSLLEDIYETDKLILEAVWQRTFEEIQSLVGNELLVNEIMSLKSDELRVSGLLILLNAINKIAQENWPALFTYALTKLLNSNTLSRQDIRKLKVFYEKMPTELRDLYSRMETTTTFGLLNFGHWEYLYAPRDNGPDSERRIPLSWSKEKNSTDSDGHFHFRFSTAGGIAISSLFGSIPKFLYIDVIDKAPYFWIGGGTKEKLQEWRIIWPHSMDMRPAYELPMALQNTLTGEYLCATLPYDENRRYVSLAFEPDVQYRPDCQWFVKQVNLI